jgi:hypothetical protein
VHLVALSYTVPVSSAKSSTDRVVAERSMLIKNLIEDLGDDAVLNNAIPIPNVNDPVLRKVIEWCEHHRNDAAQSADDDNDNRKKTTDIDEWDQKFMQVDQEMLFEIILVRHSLLDAQALRARIKIANSSARLRTTSTSRLSWMLAARPWPT